METGPPRSVHIGSRETAIAIGATTLAVAAMAVDHLLEDGGGFAADPLVFATSVALSVAVAGLVFGVVVPRTKADLERAARRGIVCSALAVLAVALVWLGLPFVLGGGGIALGLLGRGGEQRRPAGAAIVIGAAVVLLGVVIYVEQAVSKLS